LSPPSTLQRKDVWQTYRSRNGGPIDHRLRAIWKYEYLDTRDSDQLEDQNEQLLLLHLVDYAAVAVANTPLIARPLQFLRALRSRLVRQPINQRLEGSLNFLR